MRVPCCICDRAEARVAAHSSPRRIVLELTVIGAAGELTQGRKLLDRAIDLAGPGMDHRERGQHRWPVDSVGADRPQFDRALPQGNGLGLVAQSRLDDPKRGDCLGIVTPALEL